MPTLGQYPIHPYPMVGAPGNENGCKDRCYYLGVMTKILVAGRYIILQWPGFNAMLERVWSKEDVVMGMWDGTLPEGTIFYNNRDGVLIEITGPEGERQFFKPVLPDRLEGRAKRLYEYWSVNIVQLSNL